MYYFDLRVATTLPNNFFYRASAGSCGPSLSCLFIEISGDVEAQMDVDLDPDDVNTQQVTMDVTLHDADPYGFLNGDPTDPATMSDQLNAILCDHTKLHQALSSEHCDTVCSFVNDSSLLCSSDGIENCYVLITKFGNMQSVFKVLNMNPSAIHCRGPQGQTLLMYATKKKDHKVMVTLFKFGLNVNARNDKGENVLTHLIRNTPELDSEQVFVNLLFLLVNMSYIISHGLDINSTDFEGNTAIDCILDLSMSKTCAYLPIKITMTLKLLLEVETISPILVSKIVFKLAKRAYISDFVGYIVNFLKKGTVDPNVKDENGNNLMCVVIASYYEDEQDIVQKHWDRYSGEIGSHCLELMQHGCEVQGLDHIFARRETIQFQVGENVVAKKVATSVCLLSLLLRHCPGHRFFKELCKHQLKLKQSKRCVSELTYFLLAAQDNWFRFDVYAFGVFEEQVTHLLACGVNVLQQLPGSRQLLGQGANNLERKLVDTLPDALWLAAQIMLKIPKDHHFFRGSSKEFEARYLKKLFISCKTLSSLLRFWKHPPLMLFVFIYHDSLELFPVCTMLKFLARVGGRLPPGSWMFKNLRRRLAMYAARRPAAVVLPQLFKQMNEGVPSLKALCRPAVRATLSVVTSSGLDLSSLRVLCQGEMRELPQVVQDFLNFEDQPEFCPDDLKE